MATWIVHLRVAQYFMKKYNIAHLYEYAAGNLAADCGYGKKDSFGEFIPPPQITHWSPTGRKCDCDYKKFYNTYLCKKENSRAYCFYLGYYTHLLTDIIWSRMICMPTYDIYAEEYAKDPQFLRVIKLDWNDQDFRYIENNSDFEAYKILDNEKTVDDYMPYYEPNQLNTQIHGIINYYKKHVVKRNIYRKYKYLTDETLKDFMENAPLLIEKDLHSRNLI